MAADTTLAVGGSAAGAAAGTRRRAAASAARRAAATAAPERRPKRAVVRGTPARVAYGCCLLSLKSLTVSLWYRFARRGLKTFPTGVLPIAARCSTMSRDQRLGREPMSDTAIASIRPGGVAVRVRPLQAYCTGGR